MTPHEHLSHFNKLSVRSRRCIIARAPLFFPANSLHPRRPQPSIRTRWLEGRGTRSPGILEAEVKRDETAMEQGARMGSSYELEAEWLSPRTRSSATISYLLARWLQKLSPV
jgi:hypothetical protein